MTAPAVISNFAAPPWDFLSNFFPSAITYEGVTYPTVEHAFQAAKSLVRRHRRAVQHAISPSAAKRLGRAVPLRPDWEKVKDKVMLDLIRLKFCTGPGTLLQTLLGCTGNALLVEANTWHDNVWGDCVCTRADCGEVVGENRLGFTIMQVRFELFGQGSVPPGWFFCAACKGMFHRPPGWDDFDAMAEALATFGEALAQPNDRLEKVCNVCHDELVQRARAEGLIP